MKEKHVRLYDRLPEIYKIKDEEQQPPGQLKSYLALIEEAFDWIHENMELSYYDHFIETCQDWVVPYIGDLLGNSHLSGDPWTLRADVADMIALRRRKGTLLAIERLTYDLTRWGVHCVELRENLVWNQHLNHQRPDAGGSSPYGLVINNSNIRSAVIRGGTVNLRHPDILSLINTPFDPFAYLADLKTSTIGAINHNLPNLAIFLWRLKAYQVQGSKPVVTINQVPGAVDEQAKVIARVQVQPLGEPVRLFNTHRFQFAENDKPILTPMETLTQIDATPGPILRERLTTGSPDAKPNEYVCVTTYDETTLTTNESLKQSNVGLQLHMPESIFQNNEWITRGADLCAWEEPLAPALKNREVAIDPVIGRIAVGINSSAEADALVEHLLITYTYGAVGPVGAHPTARSPLPKAFDDDSFVIVEVNLHENKTLQHALDNIQDSPPLIIEIKDSMTHDLDISSVLGAVIENSEPNLRINGPLVIKADNNQRPIIKLTKPLRFRPKIVNDAGGLNVRLEGLYLTRAEGFPSDEPLIARSALNSLEIINCTLDPGGFRKLNGSRSPIIKSIELGDDYGFANPSSFKETPDIILQRTVMGPIFMGEGYSLFLSESILDAGSEVEDNPAGTPYALSGNSTDPIDSWGPSTEFYHITVLGRMRVKSINGRGGIWKNALEVIDNQRGCIKFSYFCGSGDRLPQNHACVSGIEARLHFVSAVFGNHAYGQLAHQTDFRIKERGPHDNQMGSYGFLEEAHKWRNIQIRFREFMPIGVKPLLIPVT